MATASLNNTDESENRLQHVAATIVITPPGICQAFLPLTFNLPELSCGAEIVAWWH